MSDISTMAWCPVSNFYCDVEYRLAIPKCSSSKGLGLYLVQAYWTPSFLSDVFDVYF